MNPVVRRIVSKSMEQFAGHGVGLDADDRLCFPDGLDPDRAHRFIDLVMDEPHACPREALRALFERVRVPKPAIEALDEVLTDDGRLDLAAIGRHPVHLAASLPSVRAIPDAFRSFLVDGLGFADDDCATLEAAVVSTRERSAEAIGCAPSWDVILEHGDQVRALSEAWRASTVRPAP